MGKYLFLFSGDKIIVANRKEVHLIYIKIKSQFLLTKTFLLILTELLD